MEYIMERSESIIEISKALCEFQKRVGKIKKTSDNPFFKSKYASLADILDVVQTPLSECGLSIIQMPIEENKLQTVLIHTSGEYISSTYVMRPVKQDPQSIGSCITYQRRYAIGAILCLNIDEDDDGNKASGLKIIQNTPVVSVPKSSCKKMFDKSNLEKPEFFQWIYENEKKTDRFRLRDFFESKYRIDENCLNLLVEKYTEYKIYNSL